VGLDTNCRHRTISLRQCISGSVAKNNSKSDYLVSVADQTEDATDKLLK